MAEVETVPEGTAGGAPQGEAGGSQAGDEALAALGTAQEESISPEVMAQLEKVSYDKLPEGIRKKWAPDAEKPFLANFTRRNQELSAKEQALAAKQDQLLQIATAALQKQGIAPTPDVVSALKERIEAGEFNAIPQLVNETINQQVTPQLNQMRLQGMFQEMHQRFPILKDPEVSAQVQQAFQTNPTLAAMARVGNLEGTRFVLQGLAQDALLTRVAAENKALKDGQATREKQIAEKAVADYKAKVSGLPASTSRAGTTPKGEGKEEYPSFRQAAEAALREQTG